MLCCIADIAPFLTLTVIVLHRTVALTLFNNWTDSGETSKELY